MNCDQLRHWDAQHLWHPCSQMKDYELFRPLVVERAYDCYFELDNGQKIIDAISSWWCKTLGHAHPVLREALLKQIDKFEHVILANTTNEVIVELSRQLASLMPGLNKVFYAGDGSSAVEIALKMSLHTRIIQGDLKRNKYIAFKNGYHGETLGALSVSDVGLYRQPYASMLFNTHFIEPLYILTQDDPKWIDAEEHWKKIEKDLDQYRDSATAIIFEPILQGAAGMQLYSQDFLKKLAKWAKEARIHLIADEIMTGIGRTGKMLACEHANITPNFICLSKGLTSGWMAFSAVLTEDAIYQVFYDDYETGKAFLHSHTYSGNALGASVALATLKIIQEQNICVKAEYLQERMMRNLIEVSEKTGKLSNLRGIGAMVAADLIVDYPGQRLGYEIFKEAVKLGAYLRPLGNTLYWLPPLIITDHTLNDLKEITLQAIKSVCR